MAENATAFTGSIPEEYDRHLAPVIFEGYAEDLAARLDVLPGAHVLELACGTGIVTRRLLGRLPAGARLTATDLNPAMLDHAATRVPADPRLTWRPADAMSLPFEAHAVDSIASFFPADPPQFYLTPFGYHDAATIRADLEAAGFRDIAIATVDKPAESVSAADFAIGLVRGNPVSITIEERGTTDIATVVDAIASALAAEGGAAPFRSALRARVVTAIA